jgi:[protein-PII] uridylyltransferase
MLDRHYPAYWLRVPPDRKIAMRELIREAEGARPGSPSGRPAYLRGVTEITVLAPDHPKLLSDHCRRLFRHRGNIVDAQIDTTTDGFALDTIFISREVAGDEDERAAASGSPADRTSLTRRGKTAREAGGEQGPVKGRMKAVQCRADVLVNNSWSTTTRCWKFPASTVPACFTT